MFNIKISTPDKQTFRDYYNFRQVTGIRALNLIMLLRGEPTGFKPLQHIREIVDKLIKSEGEVKLCLYGDRQQFIREVTRLGFCVEEVDIDPRFEAKLALKCYAEHCKAQGVEPLQYLLEIVHESLAELDEIL